MFRWILIGVLTGGLVGLVGLATMGQYPTIGAQDDRQDAARHALIGSWIVVDPANPLSAPSTYTIMADGTYVGQGPQPYARWTSTDRAGAWSSNADDEAELTEVSIVLDDTGTYNALIKLRGTIEVDEAGNLFTGTFDYEVTAPDGTLLDMGGPLTLEGTRIEVEPMGLDGAAEVGTPPA